ncbi:MAG: RNA-directed DNA polymerase [Lachnospiraceae bacterium]|nr:RNA-directed DNA polymerase [Lachnospiraceae bacterium]
MVYITVKQPPMYRQMTLEEFLFATEAKQEIINPNMTNTRTYEVERVGNKFLEKLDVAELITKLSQFNASTDELRSKPRKSLYREFHIPKKSGGLRKIDAPEPELMDALRRLKTIFEEDFHALYHTSAFAYVKKRSTIDAVKRHQANESKWFGKYDLSNFFGSTTLDFVMKMFSMIYPFSEVVRYDTGREELRKALELSFLDGGLPQGTPISPLITNVMMIPVDYKLANGLREFNHQRFVYTRYADDFLVSSKYTFSFKEIENYIVDTLKSFDAPFTIKPQKTRYGSSAGSNWNLGVMLNKDNEITIGHKKKRQFQAMLASYVMDKQHGTEWDKSDIQTMEGYRNYYRMVEGEAIDKLVEHVGNKFNVNIVQLIKADLRT